MKIHPSSLSLIEQKDYYKQALIILNDFYYDFSDIIKIISEYSLTSRPDQVFVNEFFEKVGNETLTLEELENYLIDIDINITNLNDYNCLILASFNKNTEIFSLLLDHGSNVNHQESYGYTSLIMACNCGNYEIVSLLIDYGADLNIQNNYGYTSLIAASRHGFLEITALLLSHGANVNIQTVNGWTALIGACYDGQKIEMITLLLTQGANVNLGDNEGRTALMWVCIKGSRIKGYLEITSLLLLHGADVKLKSKNGKTALNFAKENNWTDIVTLLLQYVNDDDI